MQSTAHLVSVGRTSLASKSAEAGPRRVIARLADLFSALMDEGLLRRADPQTAALQFKDLSVSGIYQLRMWGVIDDPTPAEIESRARTAVDTFLRAYAPET